MLNLSKIQSIIGVDFNDKDLLRTAFIHKSWSVENKVPYNNERLEFLGDSVISVIVSEYLYKTFLDKDEGDLSKLKSVLVSKSQLAKWAKQIKINNYILISSSEESTGGRKKDTIIAGVFEAILGAIYLDQGIDKCRKFIIERFLSKEIKIELKDYKSILQEILQKEFKILPTYEIVKETGPDHNKEFDCIVKLKEQTLGFGKGKTKKQAQQNAAKEALKKLEILKNKKAPIV